MKKLVAMTLFAVAAMSSTAFGFFGLFGGWGFGGGCCGGYNYGYYPSYSYGWGGCC